MRRLWRHAVFRHLVYWTLPFLAFLLLVRAFESSRTAVEVATTLFLPAPVAAYLHYFALKRFFERRRYVLYGLSVVVVVALSSVITGLVHDWIVSDENSHTSGVGTAVLVICLSTGFYYFGRGIRQQYRLQEAEAKQLQAELALLRSQLHPHFLFNTLNGLYALALDRSEQMPDVVLKLSELLRYSLDSGDRRTVPLAGEIRFLENYVDLERLRLSGEPDLRLEIRGEADGHFVAPMLAAPFIENGFKHGNLGERDDAFLHIELDIEADRWTLRVANSRSGTVADTRRGLGLANVRRRLELLHPGVHRLEIREEATRWETILEVGA